MKRPRLRVPLRMPRRRTRPRRRWVLATATVLSAAVLGLLGWTLTGSGVLAVRSVTVRGAAGALAAQVRTAAAVRAGTPLLQVDLAAVRTRVAALPPVADVTVARAWPHGLVITVRRRTAVAVFLGASGRWLVDATGRGFARPTGAVAARLPALQVPAPVADDPPRWPAGSTGAAAAVVAGELPGWLAARVTSVGGSWPDGIYLVLRSGRQVEWGGPAGVGQKAAALRLLLPRSSGPVDVSAPGVAAVG